MQNVEAVQQLVPILRAANPARPVFLLGAGASFSSGVPVADECVRRLVRRVYAERILHGNIPAFRVKTSECERWLAEQPWFRPEISRAENFPLVVENLLRPQEYRRQQLIDLMQPNAEVGPGYKTLAEFVRRGLVRTTLTTNFDPCLPMALDALRPHLPSHSEVNRTQGDFDEFDLYSRAQIVWLHGRAEGYTDRNLIDEVQRLDPELKTRLRPLLEDSPLIVVGYRGAESSITRDLLLGTAEEARGFRKGIYWCVREGEELHPNVTELQGALGSNFVPLSIAGFDELMADLAEALSGEDLYLTRDSASPATGHEPFDERPVPDASIDEIDVDLALATLREYCEHLGRPIVSRETLLPLMRELGLLLSVDGKEVPSTACLLLFANDIADRFPHAVTTTTVSDKKRTIIGGNLLAQHRTLLEWLSTDPVNPVLRVKRVAVHQDQTAYAPRALVELVVNLLVHRDYERSEPAQINIEPGRAISFRNPGGLPPSLRQRVQLDKTGRFRPIPNGTDARNRSICDVFLGLRAMEWRGTGLHDVEQLALAAGGNAEFSIDSEGDFTARITRLPSTAGSGAGEVARDDRPTGIYVLNVLPAVALPEKLSMIRLSERPSERSAPNAFEAGIAIIRDKEVWSFSPLGLLRAAFAPIAVDGLEFDRTEIEADPDRRRVISWLLRRHFENYLGRFEPRGLILEEGRGKRAFFISDDGKPRMLQYDSPTRRNIRREVVKQRAEDERAWFENEGFGYEVARLDDRWGIRIKPFYMFTGKDGATPLPSFARTARATRRIKFDRNKNVEDDLTFWSRLLADGVQTLNLGEEGTGELLFDTAFLTIEVPAAADELRA